MQPIVLLAQCAAPKSCLPGLVCGMCATEQAGTHPMKGRTALASLVDWLTGAVQQQVLLLGF